MTSTQTPSPYERAFAARRLAQLAAHAPAPKSSAVALPSVRNLDQFVAAVTAAGGRVKRTHPQMFDLAAGGRTYTVFTDETGRRFSGAYRTNPAGDFVGEYRTLTALVNAVTAG